MHIKAAEALRAVNGTLPVNLKFLIEGEEEVGGASIAKYVAANRAKLEGRRRAGFRYAALRSRSSDAVHRTARIGVHGSRGHGPGARFAFRHVRRRCAESHLRIDRTAWPSARTRAALYAFRACTTMSRLRQPPKTKAGERLPFSEADFLRNEVGASALTGEPWIFGARAALGAPDFRGPWHRGRIHRRRSEDSDSVHGHRESQLPTGAQSNSRKNRQGVSGFSTTEHAGGHSHGASCFERCSGRDGESGSSCHSDRRARVRREAREAHGFHSQRRNHSGGRRFRTIISAFPRS